MEVYAWTEFPRMMFWDLVIEVFHSPPNRINKSKGQKSQGNLSQNTALHMKNQNPTKHVNLNLNIVDHVTSNVRSCQFGATLCVFEDNESLMRMVINGRSPTMRHVSRTHRVALDWLSDSNNLDSKIQIRYTDTKHHLADMLTSRNVTRDEWNNLRHLFNISHFSSLCCAQNSNLISYTKKMAKRAHEHKEGDRIVAKSKPTAMNLTSTVSTSSSSVKQSDPVEEPGDTQSINRETWRDGKKKLNTRRSVESSRKAERCIPWRVDSWSRWENRPRQIVRNHGSFRNLNDGAITRKWQGNLLLPEIQGNSGN